MKSGDSIYVNELKEIQLDILSAVDEFCRNNNIRYTMSCGTLLGAVRHRGYIPWDDDIDTFMLREDYNQFIKLFPELYQGKYSLSCIERVDVDRVYASVYDTRTIKYEGNATKSSVGIFIDVFPVDDVPDDNKEWLCYKRKLYFFSWLRNIKFLKWSDNRGGGKNIFLYICKLLIIPIPFKWILKHMNVYAQKNNGKGYHMVYETCYGIGYERPFKKEYFDDIIDYPFEDRIFKGFKNADEYLTNTFGDYMQYPPEDERVSTHVYRAYWK